MKNENQNCERTFSLELKSKENLKNVNLTNGSHESVLIEGTLGELEHACFEEDIILEIAGQRGVLRINLHENEIKKKTSPSDEVNKP